MRSVLFLLEFALKAYGSVFALALHASCGFVPDIPCVYESDPGTRSCACLSYFQSQAKGMFKAIFVVFTAAKYCLWEDFSRRFKLFRHIVSQHLTDCNVINEVL